MTLCVSAVDCGSPEGAGNAEMKSLTSTTFNGSVMYQCFSGYWFYRDVFTLTSACQADGHWAELERRTCIRKMSSNSVRDIEHFPKISRTFDKCVGHRRSLSCSGSDISQAYYSRFGDEDLLNSGQCTFNRGGGTLLSCVTVFNQSINQKIFRVA